MLMSAETVRVCLSPFLSLVCTTTTFKHMIFQRNLPHTNTLLCGHSLTACLIQLKSFVIVRIFCYCCFLFQSHTHIHHIHIHRDFVRCIHFFNAERCAVYEYACDCLRRFRWMEGVSEHVCACEFYQLSEKGNREHRNWQILMMEVEMNKKEHVFDCYLIFHFLWISRFF